jgi:hypothetical protein
VLPGLPDATLLTVFAPDDSEDTGAALLPPLAGLQPAPDYDDGEPPEVPVPEIVEELPCWAEMAAILRLELDGPAPRDLERFRREVYAGLPQAQEATKVGG